ncbi:hypothetical protein SH139x_004171 [Planctomycetaceae bacterium SH139]
MAQYDDLNTRQIWIVGIISAVLTGITILAVQVLYYAMLGLQQDSMAEAEYTSSIRQLQMQTEQINSLGRDAEAGTIHIPIDDAMDLLIQRQGQSDQGNEDA